MIRSMHMNTNVIDVIQRTRQNENKYEVTYYRLQTDRVTSNVIAVNMFMSCKY
jgi:hypothetical protein